MAPIALFVYSRTDLARQTIDALKLNKESIESDLFIFSDGARDSRIESEKVESIRAYIRQISGFKSITIIESPTNKGLSRSIIDGVTEILKRFETVIVLEDDLLVSSSFLRFMNQSLRYYAENRQIISVSGYSYPMTLPKGYKWDVYFGIRASSWGWGTWKSRWADIDWKVSDYKDFNRNIWAKFRFNLGGSDMTSMLRKQQLGKIDSWAIRFGYHQFRNSLLDVIPKYTLVSNLGFGEGGSNCTSQVNSWEDNLWADPPECYLFPESPFLDKMIMRKFRSYNSLYARFIRRVKRFHIIGNSLLKRRRSKV